MEKSNLLKKIVVVILTIMVISLLYDFIWFKESFDKPIWKQVILAFCFLMISIHNFIFKKYALGSIYAGVVLAFTVSIFGIITV